MMIPGLRQLEGSLLLRMGGAIAAIALMAVLGMSVSWMVAQTTQGSGEAINLAGSLRMQSWRMTSHALAASQGDMQARTELLKGVAQFETTLGSDPIKMLTGGQGHDELADNLKLVHAEWHQTIKPIFLAVAHGEHALNSPEAHHALRIRIEHFVESVNGLVKQMEEATEAKILVMRVVLSAALFISLIVIVLTVHLIHTTFVQPLRDLLALAKRAGLGDLTVRTSYSGADELGQLAQAFNLMVADLQKLYQSLEERVAQKTEALSRSNQSLELLYHSIAHLHGMPPNRDTYMTILRDIESHLSLGRGMICMAESDGGQGRVIASTLEDGDINPCDTGNCTWCHDSDGTRTQIMADGRQLLVLPLSDQEQRYGVMMVNLPPRCHPEIWQIQLLEALSRHIGVAIAAERRIEQGRRLALLEERAVIARELHDSLAQSLAYMKIQVSRLQANIASPDKAGETTQVMRELREGLHSAYTQLRELLSTFRLKIEGGSLENALAQTAEEFSERSGIAIDYTLKLDRHCLSPNEEIHVLHIIREALSNVVQHAHAKHASIELTRDAEGMVEVNVADDGTGIQKAADVHHYGMTIMEERTRSLQGDIRYESHDSGTRVSLRFRPSSLGKPLEASRP